MGSVVSGIGAGAVTPSDSALLGSVTRGIYVGTTGDVRVTMSDGSIVTFAGMAAGVIHPISVVRVFATGTTATGVVAVY